MKPELVLTCMLAYALAGLVPHGAVAEPGSELDDSDPMVVITDSAITSSIEARFASDQIGGIQHVRVDTDNQGVVTLEGHVRTQETADRAIAIAKDAEGVRKVRSAIEIEIDD